MTEITTSKLFEKLKVYKNFSNDSIFFKYIFDVTDINSENSKKPADDTETFKPEFTHQIFGDEEIIFGYKNLRIDYYLTPGLLNAYIGLKCKEKITAQRFDGIEPDDVYGAFTEFGCSPGFTKNIDLFSSEKLNQDLEFVPFGSKIFEYSRDSNENIKRNNTFEIYKVDSTMPEFESEKFIDYILRVQTMLVFYIETSNFLDTEDTQWIHYLLYQKIVNTSSPSGFRYATIGYVSVYNYYSYPDKMRSRISQILIFPKYQNAGHGSELLESIYKDVLNNPNIIDITAESPSQEFMRLRDFVTTKMCSTLKPFQNKELLKKGFTNEMVDDSLKCFKIPKLQSRRCYEILRMSITNQNNLDDWRTFRLFIKNRLNKPFIRKNRAARTAGGCEKDEQSAEDTDSKLPKAISNRFGNEGETQIGFGGSSSSVGASSSSSSSSKIVNFSSKFENRAQSSASNGVTTIGFGNTGTASNNKSKSVSFSAKVTSLNTSNATTDKSSDSIDNDLDNEKASLFALNQTNMFMNEKERKDLLEQQFQEAIEEYSKVIKRLEFQNVSI